MHTTDLKVLILSNTYLFTIRQVYFCGHPTSTMKSRHAFFLLLSLYSPSLREIVRFPGDPYFVDHLHVSDLFSSFQFTSRQISNYNNYFKLFVSIFIFWIIFFVVFISYRAYKKTSKLLM